MNKKLLIFGIPLLTIVTIIALVTYGSAPQEIEVLTPIVVSSDNVAITAWLGQETIVEGNPITIENVADIGDIEVEISNDAPEGISVTYLAKLELYAKDSEWNEIGDPSEIYYTIIGEEFTVENDNDGMVINYIEPSDPYTGAFRLPTEITESFTDEKFWLVPSDSDVDVDNVLDSWNAELYKYEHDVVSYTKGNLGVVTLSEGEVLELIPIYTITGGAVGMNTVTTNVNNIE